MSTGAASPKLNLFVSRLASGSLQNSVRRTAGGVVPPPSAFEPTSAGGGVDGSGPKRPACECAKGTSCVLITTVPHVCRIQYCRQQSQYETVQIIRDTSQAIRSSNHNGRVGSETLLTSPCANAL